MAGGIDWFRWHHGSVTDPKFQLIARQARARLGDVLAVWAFVLEGASANADRGFVGNLDAEALDCLLGAEDGTTQRITDAMRLRRLIDDSGRIAAWEKRQPRREREGDSSAGRTREYRERLKQQCDADANHVTPSDASVAQKTPRGEERRGEERKPPRSSACAAALPDGFGQFWSAYPAKKAKPAAVKAWAKLHPDEQVQAAILAGIERERRSEQWTRDGGRFIPHPATWLNQRRWEDEAPTQGANGTGSAIAWWQRAGFATEGDAADAGCWQSNWREFQDGRRAEVSA